MELSCWSKKLQFEYPIYTCPKCNYCQGIGITNIFNPCACLWNIYVKSMTLLAGYQQNNMVKLDKNNLALYLIDTDNKYLFSWHCKRYAINNLKKMFYLFYTLNQVLGYDIIPSVLYYSFLLEFKQLATAQPFGFQAIKDDLF